MAQYDVNNYTVGTILANIKSGSIAIPEMQRPFVWDSTKVRDLIDSLYQGFPIGYIIVWQNPSVKLKDGTKAIGKKVLIDGQQRITAMAAAIVGQKVLNAHYKWQRISIAFNPMEEKFEVSNSANSKSSKWIPDIAPVMEPDFDTFNFVLDYCRNNGIEDETSHINSVINHLRGIQHNSLGVITLAPELDIDSVTEIFIRINSKGVVLSQADFAMSKISSNEEYGGNITRKIIDYFCHLLESPNDLKDIENNDSSFANSPEFSAIKWVVEKSNAVYKTSYSDVLHVAFTYKFKRGRLSDLVSLLSGRDFETREFRVEIEENSFAQLHEAVLETVNKTSYERFLMIVDSTGIVRNSLIRSQNALNFGYALYLALKERKIEANKIEKIVRRWLVLSILTSRYSSSPESVFDFDIKRFFAYKDPMEYLELTEAGELSDAFWNVTLVQRLNTSVASSPYFNLYLMTQAKGHDKGFLSEQIGVQTMLENKGDIHHLFPKNYLVKNNIPQSQYNQIANYALIQQEINIKISDKAPCEYMQTVFEQCQTKKPVYGGIVDDEQLRENLRQNCIPEGFENMDVSDYADFLEKRRKLMAEKIRDYYYSL
ncbi:MAG: DUF262 domain-containing protein [Oscillospiraceae bacterium]|nr:DUF262 domain-containing protein [Oscillospiraceae bacterium]